MVPDLSIEALPIPFAAISTDMAAEREVVFDRGSLFDAIRASISLPAFFRPVHKSDMVLMDGGILQPSAHKPGEPAAGATRFLPSM